MRNHATKKWWQREPFISIIAAVSASVVTFVLTYSFSAESVTDGVVQAISQRFSFVDASMSYEKAIEEVYTYNQELEREIQKMSEQLDKKYDVQFYSPVFVKDGLQLENEVSDTLLLIDGIYYMRLEEIQLLTDNQINFYEDQNMLANGITPHSVSPITKVDIFETNILYDGYYCEVYRPSDGKKFSIAGKDYTKGAVISTGYSMAYDLYGLFNLEGKYSSLSLSIGCIDGASRTDVTMDIFLDGVLAYTYELSADIPIYNIEIPLNYANSMKLNLDQDFIQDSFSYGITQAILTM